MRSDRRGDRVSDRWASWRATTDLEEYHTRWQRMEASGQASHGEADLISSYEPSAVLDAGCGMGRVAIELAARGIDVVGVDLDDDLLSYARQVQPALTWLHADLADTALDRHFDVVALAGNVMIFCRPSDRGAIVGNLARHLAPGGLLVAGFDIERGGEALTVERYDELCADAGLELAERWSTWQRDPYRGGTYAVSVHRRAPVG